jgi:hypothetical protein
MGSTLFVGAVISAFVSAHVVIVREGEVVRLRHGFEERRLEIATTNARVIDVSLLVDVRVRGKAAGASGVLVTAADGRKRWFLVIVTKVKTQRPRRRPNDEARQSGKRRAERDLAGLWLTGVSGTR